jgi:hypothetical protein
LVVNPSVGEVYLVTVIFGANIDRTPAVGLAPVKMKAVDGSFQVLVIGN